MIHRQNWLDTRAFTEYLDRQLGRHPKSLMRYRIQLRHLLEWADDTPFQRARDIDPVFPAYLMTARSDGKPQPLAYSSIYKTLITVRGFFQWARLEYPGRYRRVTESWINLLRPARASQPQPQLHEHRFYRLEDVQALAGVSMETLHDQRALVGAALLFVSGMRPDTLASLPIACVDLPHRRIQQLPTMGVRTKNNKAAITYLLDIPELLAIVSAWDQRVRSTLPPEALWYATLNTDLSRVTDTRRAIFGRGSVIGDDLRMLCAKAGIEYLSPHKLRHGHIVYARNLAHNMAELKAISQNVMHSNVIITDQVYADLTSAGVGSIITTLGKQSSTPDASELIAKITTLLAQLKAGS